MSPDIVSVIEHEGIQPTEWDLLIVADGGGCGWQNYASWAFATLDRRSGECAFHVGGASCGTISRVEVEPLLHALARDLYGVRKGRKPVDLHERRVVVFITDSAATVGLINRASEPGLVTPFGEEVPDAEIAANADLINRFKFFRRCGYDVRPVQVPRNTLAIHRAMDKHSRGGKSLKESIKDVNAYELFSPGILSDTRAP